jgi:hypothetical protein
MNEILTTATLLFIPLSLFILFYKLSKMAKRATT